MHRSARFSYIRSSDLDELQPRRVPIVIVGAGLVGLTLALALAKLCVRTLVLEARDSLTEGSRAIVFAQRSLEILARLGLGEQMLEKGIGWKIGRVYHREREAFSFDFQSEPGYEFPAFINVQQSYVEEWLVEACRATGLVDLRSLNRVVSVDSQAGTATIGVDTPDGAYALCCDWLIACDGARSFVRSVRALPMVGRMFHDRFLIVDVEMEPGFVAERRFWFDPPFHRGHVVLIHKQPDNLWRVDFQLGPDADPVAEREPQRVTQRLGAMFGEDLPFRIDWISVYSFRCRRLEHFVHERIVFAGDSAHEVSPFGGRGGNGGIQDADNLGWKIAATVRYGAASSLIRSYDEERIFAADENILNSTRSAYFISPESEAVKVLREATLTLASRTRIGKALVNSGRLSRPSALNGIGQFAAVASCGTLRPGSPAADASVKCGGRSAWLLNYIGTTGFTLLLYGDPRGLDIELAVSTAREAHFPTDVIIVSPVERLSSVVPLLWDHDEFVLRRYGLQHGHALLFRPDQHLLEAFPSFERESVLAALSAALSIPLQDVLVETLR